jgi:hypothetical protein
MHLGLVNVELVMDNVTLTKLSLPELQYSPVSIITSTLHTQMHLINTFTWRTLSEAWNLHTKNALSTKCLSVIVLQTDGQTDERTLFFLSFPTKRVKRGN